MNAALGMAADARQPPIGTVIHSDHRSQYTSWTFSKRVHSFNLIASLGTVGDAYDNALGGELLGRMQTELLNTRKWKTRVELSTAMFNWIEAFCNKTRRHSSLDMLSPIAYEKLRANRISAACLLK